MSARHLSLLLLSGLLSLAGCDGDNTNDPQIPGGGGEGDSGVVEKPTGRALSVLEDHLSVRFTDTQALITVTVRSPGAGALEGQLKLEMVDLSSGEAIAEASQALTLDAEEQRFEVPLSFERPEAQAELAGYVIRYRIETPRESVWGRRSLFAAAEAVELQLRGPDVFQTGATSHMRLIARQPSSGQPLAELPAVVTLERPDLADVVLFEGRTDAFGSLDLVISPDDDLAGQGQLVLTVETAEGPQRISNPVEMQRATKILFTTDKPLYQPGQIIHMRALALRRPSLEPDANQTIVFEISDAKDNKIERLEARTDDFGVASAQLQLAREINMGSWRLAAVLGDDRFEKTVTVDRYSLPKFDLTLTLDQAVYLAGATLSGTISAQYFFGQPVDGQLQIVGATYDAGRTVFAEIQGQTNDAGLYEFQMQLPNYIVGLPLEQGGGLVELTIIATDSAGQSRSLTKTVRVASAPLEVVMVPESGGLVPGMDNRFYVRCVDATGQPVAAHNTLTIEGMAPLDFDANADGLATLEIPIQGETLMVHLVTSDETGNRVEQDFSFTADPGQLDGAVLLRADAALYRVGDTANLEIRTIGAPDLIYLDVIRGGQTVLTDVITLEDGQAAYPLTLTPEHTGALQIDAYYLALGSSLRRDSKIIYVDPAQGLSIEVEADADVYQPADEAQLTFRVTDGDGVGRPTAIGVQIVDEAVFSLMEFRAGLEKLYFQIEGSLMEPRYQVGVPGLSTLAATDDVVDDERRQEEARLLFAATDGAAAPISINTYAQAQAQLVGVVQPFVKAAGDAYISNLATGFQAGIITLDNLADVLAAELAGVYDPWGQTFQGRYDANEGKIYLISAGPDERPETADDITLSYWAYEAQYGNQNGGGRGDWDDDGMPMAGEGEFAADGDGMMDPGAGGAGGAAPPPSAGGNSAPRVRRYFPETLLVTPALITDAQGEAKLTVPLADSITTWRVTALANTMTGLLGSTEAGVRVFQDFFVDIDFPAVLTRGDAYSVPVAIYNYLDEPQTVRLEVVAGDWYELLDGQAVIEIVLGPGEVTGVRLPLRVHKVGVHELTVYAYGSRLQDAVARAVRVEPDGQLVERVMSGRLEGPISEAIRVPAEAIEGSGKLLVKIYPGLFASIVEGLDGVLRMPSGCFEQTSSSTWPNVLVARYLADTDTGTPEVLATAHQYINTGYQRLLTFESPNGGFEWFGGDPGHVVLTAYGLLEFTDMAQVRLVDPAMIARTQAWLLAQQQGDGHWEAARGLDETGNLTNPVTITAYVAFALAEAGVTGAPLERAKGFLQGQMSEMGTYSLALFANFMVAYQPDDSLTQRLIDQLAERVEAAIQGGDEAAPGAHWQTDEQTTTYGSGEPAYIETTALATHALLASGREIGVANEALVWLVSKKNPHGAWGSTAGTVWTIKCMLEALRGGQDEAANATVTVLLDGEARAEFRVTPETSDVMRQADLTDQLIPGQAQQVEIRIEGQGNLQYGVVEAYHQPWSEAPPAEGPLSLEVSYDRTQLSVDDTVEVTVTVRNTAQEYVDMVMVDLGIPPGFELVRDDLNQLVSSGVFSKYEATERQLLLYFTAIPVGEPITFSYHIIARNPIEAQAPRSHVYSYYNPDVGAESEPVDVEVN
ncbi:hypothetical protein KKF91_02630 [Myxococcota bacterium]|nr:hypothetical protein [Myxococcota bacterium]MBU1429436.1 hypothetical protein [Myxococcota bacterium]MBU1897196.1 hypothetical protein [Myxococcota bacterium]